MLEKILKSRVRDRKQGGKCALGCGGQKCCGLDAGKAPAKHRGGDMQSALANKERKACWEVEVAFLFSPDRTKRKDWGPEEGFSAFFSELLHITLKYFLAIAVIKPEVSGTNSIH